ncbi:hypothetical protein Y032_0170g239 [Ancylostoma ceylanicum]|uniref:Uncharacterized protein n=1 Tax=Ancylostoma ceylanicum TaxID=53326 RepID=A0A016SVT9_9BILA|nr:hypothetical protein Y032_0170g239 [Ancylostoma ceylanicum]
MVDLTRQRSSFLALRHHASAIKDVDMNGVLHEHFFMVGESATSSVYQTDDNAERGEEASFMKNAVAEIIDLTKTMERSISREGIQTRAVIVTLDKRIEKPQQSHEQLRALLPVTTAKRWFLQVGPNYEFLPRERVETLVSLKHNNINKFALALEKEVYKEDPADLLLLVDERKHSWKKVEFIRERRAFGPQ